MHNYVQNLSERKLWQQMKYESYDYYNFPNVWMTLEVIKHDARYAYVSKVYSTNDNGFLNTPEGHLSLLRSITIKQSFHRLNSGHEFYIPTEGRKIFHMKMRPEIFNLWTTAERTRCRHQQQFSINMWLENIGDCLAGPRVLPHRPTSGH